MWCWCWTYGDSDTGADTSTDTDIDTESYRRMSIHHEVVTWITSYPIQSYHTIFYHIISHIKSYINLTPKPRIHIFIHHIISCNHITTRRSFIHSYPASPLARLEGKSTDNGNVFTNVACIDNIHVFCIYILLYIIYWTTYTIYCIPYSARLWILTTTFTTTTATLPGLTFPITNNH